MVFIELCAGSAVLSATAQRHGYRVLPVTARGIDISLGVALSPWICQRPMLGRFWEYIVDTCDVAAMHFAPPCGTCSKARGIPMPDGTPGPQPLRTAEHLLGVPDMTPLDRIKVNAANMLYERMGKFIEWLDSKGVAWVLENPTNSFLWELWLLLLCCATWVFCALSCLRIREF